MGLTERENRRKQSVVGSMLSSSSGSQNDEIVMQDINIIPKTKIETRSKRINLLITPSLYMEVQEKCERMGISLNECINQFLSNWVEA